jgi:hypothetical protein
MNNAKNITLADVLAFIASSDRETRRAVNREIIAMADDEERAARDEFRIGDKVKFSVRKRPYFGRVITGVVVRRNIKTIEVKPDGGGRNWKVAASLLSKA